MTRWPPAAMAAWDVPTIKQNMNLNITWVLTFAYMCVGVRMNLYFLSQHYTTAHISVYVCMFAHVFVFLSQNYISLHDFSYFRVCVWVCFTFCLWVYRRVFMGEYVSVYMFLYLWVYLFLLVYLCLWLYMCLIVLRETKCWLGEFQGYSIHVKKSRKSWPRIYNVYFSTVVSHYTCHILVRTALIRKGGI